MKGSGIRQERETIIRFDEDSDMASIWTASETVYRRLLKRLGRAFLTEDGERHAIFEFPVKLIVLPMNKAPKVLTPEHKAKLLSGRVKSIHRGMG